MLRLTRLARRARLVVAAVGFLAVLAGIYGAGVADRLDPFGFDDPQEERVQADRLLERASGVDPEPQMVVLVKGHYDSGSTQRTLTRVRDILQGYPAVGAITGPEESPLAVSRERDAAYLLVYFRAASESAYEKDAVILQDQLSQLDGVLVGGEAVGNAEIGETIEADLLRAEMVAFPIVLLLSVWFFRSLVAALLPPLIGLVTILGTFALLALVAEVTSLSVFALNLVTGLGLGLAIDYSLFIVSRYREELARHGPGAHAILCTLRTSGVTVLFSAITVAGALASLLVFPQRFLFSMGVGGLIAPLLAAATALILLPAVFFLLGERINAGAPRWLRRAAEREARPVTNGRWYRLARFVMRRPLLVALATTAVLLTTALPVLQTKFTQVDARVLPHSSDARQAFAALRNEFPGLASPITVVVRSTDARRVRAFADSLGRLEGVTGTSGVERVDRGLWRIDLSHPFDPLGEHAQNLVQRVRQAHNRPPFLVTGEAAAQIDRKDSIGRHAPLALAILAGVTFLVLFAMTASVVLAAKQILMNAVVLATAFGVLVFIFQEGRLESLLGYESLGALELSQPLLIIAIVFGLATDYGVFLFSRVMEARAAGAADDEAVSLGVERTGRIVTAAAVLFSVVMGAIATSDIVFIQQLAVAISFAVLVDAFVVRALLVPSLMRLLGRYNWWAPRRLVRFRDAIMPRGAV